MVVKRIKSFLVLVFLVFAFIDAANIVDLFSNTEVIHFEEGSPSDSDYLNAGITVLLQNFNSALNSLSNTNLKTHSPKKSAHSKLLIFDQDSPSVVHEVEHQEQSVASIKPADQTIPAYQTVPSAIYIDNCSLQI